jgi:hypothetical protein
VSKIYLPDVLFATDYTDFIHGFLSKSVYEIRVISSELGPGDR